MAAFVAAVVLGFQTLVIFLVFATDVGAVHNPVNINVVPLGIT